MNTVLLVLMCFLLNGPLIFAQEVSTEKVIADQDFSRLHFALLFGTGEGTNGNIKSALHSSLGNYQSEGNLSVVSLRGEYYIQKKWGMGFQFSNGTQEAYASLYKGSEYVPASWFIFY